MGFFKELKNDLSQAMNELLPDEVIDNSKTVNPLENKSNEINSESAVTQEVADSYVDENVDMDILDAILTQDEKSEEMNNIPDERDFSEVKESSLKKESSISSTVTENNDLSKELDRGEKSSEKDSNSKENLNTGTGTNTGTNAETGAITETGTNTKTGTEKTPIRKDDTSGTGESDEVTIISKGTVINGNLTSNDSLEVMGTIKGDVECRGKLSIMGSVTGNCMAAEVFVDTKRLVGCINSESSVKIGLGTVIIGDITASSAYIAGAIKGEIDVNGPIVIDSAAVIKGNIKAQSIQINNGAIIEGFCSLAYASIDIDNIFE